MNALESRKKLLLAASEINRTHLMGEVAALTADVHKFADRAKSLGALASSAAVLIAGLAAFQRGKAADPGAKTSWVRKLMKGAGLISTLWLAFRPQGGSRGGA